MTAPQFKHQDLKLLHPNFDTSLTDLIIELDYLRKKKLEGSTHPQVFFQLKQVFHFLESWESARIEGNNTTIAEYLESKISPSNNNSEKLQEIRNIEDAMRYVEAHIKDAAIDTKLICELHQIIVAGLSVAVEGDKTPGKYRTTNLKITQSAHLPPDWLQVDEYMRELYDFIAEQHGSKYDLLKAAIAHHRFVWAHPFGNGNGRTVRVFTYAMLIKWGFNVGTGRILNPTAVFCNNRQKYYDYLALADNGTNEGMLAWVEYVLKGLKEEIEKIDKLLDYNYLKTEILLPALTYALEKQYVTVLESQILKRVIQLEVIKAGDIKDIFIGKKNTEISRQISRLINRGMLVPENPGARKYLLRFDNNLLLRAIVKQLSEKSFLPVNEEII
ncbi:MAG: Fic family protein [Sphingobacteriales bacterium]|nr:MAG: Fic family protein [Sphingobacteriales bacterium]